MVAVCNLGCCPLLACNSCLPSAALQLAAGSRCLASAGPEATAGLHPVPHKHSFPCLLYLQLDGELVVLDGVVYQQAASGACRVVQPDEKVGGRLVALHLH